MKKIISIIILFIVVSCAQQSMLTGGEKDIKAPSLIEDKTNPKNFSTNFNSKVIQLYFDEYVQLKDAKNNFFVNPTIENINLEEKGKSILIHINESLKQNTTYTFNFGSSIQDITENNPYKDFNYVLSTGDFIDSNLYHGCVYDAFSKKPLDNIKVMLYENKLDSLTEKTTPNYLCTTNELGKFKLGHLKEGSYFILAVDDKNKNSFPDPKNEKIAFDFNPIETLLPGDSSANDTILMFLQDAPLKVLEKSYLSTGKFQVLFNKKIAINNIKIDSINCFIEPRKFPTDTLTFWVESLPSSSLTFKLSVKDEFFSKDLKINTYTASSTDSVYTCKAKNINNLRPNDPLTLSFNHPIKSISNEKIHFLIDSVKSTPVSYFEGSMWYLTMPNAVNATYELIAEPGAFESIYGYKNDSVELLFKQKSPSAFGDLFLDINCNSCEQFIVELMNKEALVKKFICNNNQLTDTIRLCNPGNYQLRLVNDLNKDGEWTTGNFNTLQPEPVFYYNEPMAIKPGWGLNIEWVIR